MLFPIEIFSLKYFQVKLSSLFVYCGFALRHCLIINLTNLSNQQVKHDNRNQVDVRNPESPDNRHNNVSHSWRELKIFSSFRIISPFGVIIYLQISNWDSECLDELSQIWMHTWIIWAIIWNLLSQNNLEYCKHKDENDKDHQEG